MNEEYVVSGISFTDRKEYEAALKDQSNIEYLSARMDLSQPRTVLRLYKSLIEKNTFRTLVGFVFLKQLYDVVSVSNEIDRAEIPLIDQKVLRGEKETNKSDNATVLFAKNDNVKKLKNSNRIMICTIVMLVVGMIAMFIFTVRADTLTYDQAKESVINEYEEWNNELNEREADIEKREDALNIQK